MHLIQLYALSSSSTIDKPQITLKYFPLTVNKYITLHTTSKETKSYSYWQEVVQLLLLILNKEGISIVQIGQKDEIPIQGCIHLLGQTSINQSCYILSNSLLHMGADSFPVHFCSSLSKKILALYSNNYISNVGPYWSKPEDVILLEPERKNGEKPSFMIQGEKSINSICPIKIAESVLKLLNIEWKSEYKTLQIGPNYHNKIVESANDCVIDVNKLGLQNIVVRNDYNYNIDFLFQQCSVAKVVIITEKSLPIELLQRFKPNIIEVLYKITKEHNPQFVKDLSQIKIPYKLFSEMSDENLNPIKLDYLDSSSIIFKRDINIPEVLKNIDLNKIWYKSSRFLLGRGKIYPSLFDYKSDRFINSFDSIPLQLVDINPQELYESKDNLYFLEKI